MLIDVYTKREVDIRYMIVEVELDNTPYKFVFDLDSAKVINNEIKKPNTIQGKPTSKFRYRIYNGTYPHIESNELLFDIETDTIIEYLCEDGDYEGFYLELEPDGSSAMYKYFDVEEIMDELGLCDDYPY